MIDLATLPDRALSIMQPWAWLIVNGHKHIENRDWPTKFRGPVCIHAGKKFDQDCAWELSLNRHPVTGERFTVADGEPHTDECGGIVGVAEIVGCVRASPSKWFVGKYGFVIANARPVEFIPVKGALGFFNWRAKL
ncbi:ASCH domain-containing protein [Mesorhizobium sp. M0296]|uniref:ASCH domain-containing protein n=1 Tax=Mesorhizobium sp. M0296 TaxID=2956931 RepID=UPI00333A8CC5